MVVTLDSVHIEGHSAVHPVASDCEMHLGAHTISFAGDPDGLVLEPMNACVQPLLPNTPQNNKDWTDFGDKITGTSVTASGVPRIWPEHLIGGGASNPNHAVELHPLTELVSASGTFDFAPNIFAGGFQGGLSESTALKIVQQLAVTVTTNGKFADISFSAGTIGNFTVLDLAIDPNSIRADAGGSFRMDGEVDSVPVRLVTAKGSLINDEIKKLQSGGGPTANIQALVLFSLSPESLLAAANKSNGSPTPVERPIQLILYGPPE